MEQEVEVLVELLTDVLGKPKQHYESKYQITFNCPRCAEEKGLDNGDGKGNFEVNYRKHVYHCWACGETYGILKLPCDRFCLPASVNLVLINPEVSLII